MQEEISQTEDQTKDLNASGGEAKPTDDKRYALEGEGVKQVANFAPGEVIDPKDTHHILCQTEMDRIRTYAKKIKMKPWSEDILWLLDQLNFAVHVANEADRKASLVKASLDKVTNGGFDKLKDVGNFLTEVEDRTLTPEQKEQKAMNFLHKQTCCKCGDNTWPPKKTDETEKAPGRKG